MFWGKQRSTSSPSRLFCSSFSVSVLNFATSPNSGVKFFGGFLRSDKSILRFFFFWLCVFFLVFWFLLLRSRDIAEVKLIDLENAANPEEADELEDMTADEMAVDGYYVVAGIARYQ